MYKARSIDTIFTSILNEKTGFPSLVNLNTTVSSEQTLLQTLSNKSKVAIWVMWSYISARVIWALEKLMELHSKEVEDIRDTGIVGNEKWYAYKATQFQFGDNVIVNESTQYAPQYAIVNENKKIVKSATAYTTGNKLVLKIRGRDTDILTDEQLLAFKTYINKIKFAGIKTIVWNIEPDELKLIGVIKYSGTKLIDEIRPVVEATINNYITNLPFDGEFVINDLIVLLKAIDGVINPQFDTFEVNNAVLGQFEPIVHSYKSYAGYFKVSDDFPLSTFIQYQAI